MLSDHDSKIAEEDFTEWLSEKTFSVRYCTDNATAEALKIAFMAGWEESRRDKAAYLKDRILLAQMRSNYA